MHVVCIDTYRQNIHTCKIKPKKTIKNRIFKLVCQKQRMDPDSGKCENGRGVGAVQTGLRVNREGERAERRGAFASPCYLQVDTPSPAPCTTS